MKTIQGFLLTITLCLLSACTISRPINGKTDKGENFYGEAKASIFEGDFIITGASGVSCRGDYNQFSMTSTFSTQAACSDGRTANILITLDPSLENGWGQGLLSDGTKFRFLLGNPNPNAASATAAGTAAISDGLHSFSAGLQSKADSQAQAAQNIQQQQQQQQQFNQQMQQLQKMQSMSNQLDQLQWQQDNIQHQLQRHTDPPICGPSGWCGNGN